MWASNGLERLGCEVDGVVVLMVVVLVEVVMVVSMQVLLGVVMTLGTVVMELTGNGVTFKGIYGNVLSK